MQPCAPVPRVESVTIPSFATSAPGNRADRALAALGGWLRHEGYRFTAVTPATHAAVNARPGGGIARTIADVFGWSRPFAPALLPRFAVELLEQGNALEREGWFLKSTVRFSTLGDLPFVHSAFPTVERDAVFFGPDTYRFARFIEKSLGSLHPEAACTLIDVGCGTGAGGIFASTLLPRGSGLFLTDINAKALHYAWVNAKASGTDAVTLLEGDLFQSTPARAALIVANPPYLVDGDARMYRNGGGALGSELSLRIVREGLPVITPGGAIILYTGAPVVAGIDALRAALIREADAAGCVLAYEELDPDVFGEELHRPPYTAVDRIAAVGAVIRKPGPA
jgi:SAM-dependent methyltransferase